MKRGCAEGRSHSACSEPEKSRKYRCVPHPNVTVSGCDGSEDEESRLRDIRVPGPAPDSSSAASSAWHGGCSPSQLTRSGIGSIVVSTTPNHPSDPTTPMMKARFGLGRFESEVSVTVLWPSGTVQELTGVSTEQQILIPS